VAAPPSLLPLPSAVSSPVNIFLATFLLGDGQDLEVQIWVFMFNKQLVEVKKNRVADRYNFFFVVLFNVFVEELPGASAAATKALSCVKIHQN